MPPFTPNPPDAAPHESDEVLVERLTALAREIDPPPARVTAQARAARAARAGRAAAAAARLAAPD